MNPLQQTGLFLIHTLFDLYLMVLVLRLLFQYFRVDYYNPLSQFIVKITSPVVVPLRRVIPGFWGIDVATVLIILLFTMIKISALTFIVANTFPTPVGLVFWSLGELVALTIKLFFYMILISVILSWVAPLSHSPVSSILYQLTEPVMRPARRLLPPIGGFDLSPIIVLVILQVINILLATPLTQFGTQLAMH